MGVWDAPLWEVIAAASLPRLGEFGPAEVGMLVWALSKGPDLELVRPYVDRLLLDDKHLAGSQVPLQAPLGHVLAEYELRQHAGEAELSVALERQLGEEWVFVAKLAAGARAVEQG